jgi:hypothetical protein
VYLTYHAFFRGIQRDIFPKWLHKSTAELFILSKINQTLNKQKFEYGTLQKILLPDLKIYVRDNKAIVTMIKRKIKKGVF